MLMIGVRLLNKADKTVIQLKFHKRSKFVLSVKLYMQ